jgi:L-lactate dehydrogenase complex protein LldF
MGLMAWAAAAKRPRLYHALVRILMPVLGSFGRRRGSFRWLPLTRGWTRHRDFPSPQGRTFQALWADTKAGVPR